VMLYLHSPIRHHGMVLSLKEKHRDNFTFTLHFTFILFIVFWKYKKLIGFFTYQCTAIDQKGICAYARAIRTT
jgi:hypothetical protein